ncbi:MAG: sporulation protein YqfD [Oscillospiraceae bacterium]|nr:sporulation protein YqfD [Oscillospiraceae bacterium]
MQIREFCDIQADGRSPYPFINAVRRSPVACGNQYCKGRIFCFRIARKDLPEIQHLAEIYHMKLTVSYPDSLIGRCKKYRFRIGIPFGILLSALVIFYYSNTVTEIEIQGTELVKDSVILSLLEQEGVSQGTWITDIDMNHCETVLRVKIPEIAWAGIRSTGNRLVVQVTEEKAHIPMVHERTPCNIISRYNAQITDVRIYSGQLLRLIGDGVSAGEVIVSGVIQDDAGHISYRHALGSITGIYTQKAELTEYFTDIHTEQTGRSVTQTWFQLFQIKIPLGLRKPSYAESSVKEFYTPFCFSGHILPAGIFRRTTSEKRTSVTEYSEEETVLALNADIVRYEKNFLSDNIQILDCQKEYLWTETGITCRLTYTLKGEIGITSDFFVK